MASPTGIKELRIKLGTTARTTFENAAVGSWDQTNTSPEVIKLKALAYDPSGLSHDGIKDTTLQQRFYSSPPAIPGLRTGKVKFTTYMPAANGALTASPEVNILGALWGGVALPTNARGTTVSGTSPSTVNVSITSASTYAVAGQAALIGTRGDGRGNGRVYPINAVASGSIGLALATTAAPTTGDVVVFSSTCYPQENVTQTYIDTLAIGTQPGGVPTASADQIQTIGGAGTVKMTSLGVGDLPKMEIELDVMDWQYANVGSRASISPHATSKGGNPPFEKGTGMFHIGDTSTSVQALLKAGDFSFTDGITYAPVPGFNGINAKEAFQKIPGEAKLECTVLVDEDMLGLLDDFQHPNGMTAKRIVLQMGHTNTKCCALELPKAYLDAAPIPTALGNLQGVKLKIHAEEFSETNNNLVDAAWKLHAF